MLSTITTISGAGVARALTAVRLSLEFIHFAKERRHGGRLLRETESASYVAAGLRAGVLLRTQAAIRTAALGSVGMTNKCCMPGRKA